MTVHNSAAVLVISNDVLCGKRSFNSYISLQLSLMSEWNILKFAVLPRNQRIIKYEVEVSWKLCDIVIVTDETTTCDLNICEIIAEVFNESVTFNSKLMRILGTESEISDPKQAQIPVPAKLLSCDLETVPVIALQRIFILKGTASNIVKTFNNILKPYLNDFQREVLFKKKFQVITNNKDLQELRKGANSNVNFTVEEIENGFQVTASSTDCDSVIHFKDILFAKCNTMVKEIPCENLAVFDTFYYQVDPYIKATVRIIEECFSQYGHENVFISFNGGKDCTVLLHLTLATLRRIYPNNNKPFLCWYVRSPNAFPEQDAFISKCERYYNLEVMTVHTDIKEGLALVLKSRPNMKACLMGTRRTDPFSEKLENFQATDPGWPQVIRVFPLLDWHYSYIWDYLLYFKVPYCELYDKGYTSLGNLKNTVRNPSLLSYDILRAEENYLPAYKLLESSKERNGRLTR